MDPVTNLAFFDGLLLQLVVEMATFMAVHAAHSRSGAQGRQEEKGLLELHLGGPFRFSSEGIYGRVRCDIGCGSARTAGKSIEGVSGKVRND